MAKKIVSINEIRIDDITEKNIIGCYNKERNCYTGIVKYDHTLGEWFTMQDDSNKLIASITISDAISRWNNDFFEFHVLG